MALGFFEPQKGQTATGIAQSRALAAALLRNSKAPANIGEGLNAIGDSILYRSLISDADASEKAGTDAFNNTFNSLISPYSGGSAPGGVAAALSSSGPSSVPQTADANAIREGLISRGLPSNVADAFVVNFQDESGLNPGINEAAPIVPGSRGGFGLAQWTGPRRVALEDFASQRGVAPSDTNTQLDFLVNELKGSEAGAAKSILGAKDTAGAAQAIVNNFLRPAEQHRAERANRYASLGGEVSPQAMAPELPPPTTISAAPAVAEAAPLAAPQQVAQNFQPQQIDPRLIEAANSPFATPGQKAILGGIIQQQQQRNQLILKQQMEQADPAYQMGLEKNRIELDRLKNPGEPADIQELRIRAKEAGIQPGTPEYQALFASGGESPLVTVNNGDNSGAFAKKSDEEAATRLGSIVSEGNAAPQLIGDLQQLAELGKQIGTGKGAQVTAAIGPYAQALGIDVKGLDESQAFTAIVNRLAPQMRPVGAGATSDFDARQFLSSLPSLGNQPGGNELISQTFQAVQQNKIAAAEIASKAQTGEIKWQEAERQIRALPNPYEVFKTNREKLGQANSGGTPLLPTPSPQGQRPRATNPQTGEVIEFDGKGWVPVQ